MRRTVTPISSVGLSLRVRILMTLGTPRDAPPDTLGYTLNIFTFSCLKGKVMVLGIFWNNLLMLPDREKICDNTSPEVSGDFVRFLTRVERARLWPAILSWRHTILNPIFHRWCVLHAQPSIVECRWKWHRSYSAPPFWAPICCGWDGAYGKEEMPDAEERPCRLNNLQWYGRFRNNLSVFIPIAIKAGVPYFAVVVCLLSHRVFLWTQSRNDPVIEEMSVVHRMRQDGRDEQKWWNNCRIPGNLNCFLRSRLPATGYAETH